MKFAAVIFYLLAFVTASCSIAFALTLVSASANPVDTWAARFLHHLLTYSWPAGLVITSLLWVSVHFMQKRRSRN